MQEADELIKLSDPGEVGRNDHNRVDRAIIGISNIFAWTFPILMIAICAQVVLRASGFNQAWLDDLQWWMYGGAALIAIGYAVTTDSHVRVDIFYENFSPEKKARIEVFALAWLFLPFAILAWDITVPYALQSISNNEGSSSPNGLHKLWILKSFMNLAFIFIIVSIWAAYARNLEKLTEPTLGKQLLWAFPSTMFVINLIVYYTIWWALRLTSAADVTDRDIGRAEVFGEIDLGRTEIKYTILITIVVTALVLLLALLRDRRRA